MCKKFLWGKKGVKSWYFYEIMHKNGLISKENGDFIKINVKK